MTTGLEQATTLNSSVVLNLVLPGWFSSSAVWCHWPWNVTLMWRFPNVSWLPRLTQKIAAVLFILNLIFIVQHYYKKVFKVLKYNRWQKMQKFCFRLRDERDMVSEEYTWFIRGSQGWVNGVRVKKEVLWRGEAGRIHGRHATASQEGHLMSRILGVRLEAGIKYQWWRK